MSDWRIKSARPSAVEDVVLFDCESQEHGAAEVQVYRGDVNYISANTKAAVESCFRWFDRELRRQEAV